MSMLQIQVNDSEREREVTEGNFKLIKNERMPCSHLSGFAYI